MLINETENLKQNVSEKKATREYSDLLLVDLLHPDWKNFFKRYRVDVIGFLCVIVIIIGMVFLLKVLASIGA